MFKAIEKRDGTLQIFDIDKIERAVLKALEATYNDRRLVELERLAEVVTDRVIYMAQKQFGNDVPTVEVIQDIVEITLMDMGERQTAKNYIRYRLKREAVRQGKKILVDVQELSKGYITQSDWRVKENANMDFSLQGFNNSIVENVTKNLWLHQIYPPEVRESHINGDLHIHDLGLLATYCVGWSLEDLLLKGYRGANGKVESSPPKHFGAALGQVVNFLYTLQGESAGAQALSSFDTYLAPFIKHDGLTYEEVKQSMQEHIFNLNIPTRVGFQTPFTNYTMDLNCPKMLSDQPVIIGGKYHETDTYGMFQKEMDMINQAFCEVMMEGDAKGRIFTFPIPTYNIGKNFEWDRPIVDKVMEMTAKYGTPYFANFVNSDMDPEDARSMCCRLRLDNRELRKRGGGLFGANPLTGSIGVVTINLPRLGYLAVDKEDFFERLTRLMGIARNSLEIKRKIIEKNTVLGLYPYSRFYLSSVHERFGEYWKNHFNTIGINGMNECIKNFLGLSEDITTEKGKEFAEEILNYMRDVMVEYQEKTGDMFNLEATPAEGTAYRLARIDKEKFPDIIASGTDESYYTNSSQLPVGHTEDLFEALDLQDPLQTKYTGGTVFHAFIGERISDINTCKALVKKVMENYHLPYFSVTPTFSICPEHGYIAGEHFECPTCGREAEVWSRVVGFYRPVSNWNKGKKEEFEERKEFVM